MCARACVGVCACFCFCFQVDSGRQWFLHAIYTVRSGANAGRGIGKRSAHALFDARHLATGLSRVKREQDDLDGVGQGGKGTNMARVQLRFALLDDGDVSVGTNTESDLPLIPIIISLVVFAILCLLLAILIVRRRRNKGAKPPPYAAKPPPPPQFAAKPVTVSANGHTRVLLPQAYNKDNTEV